MATPLTFSLAENQLRWLLAGLSLAILPHVLHLPAWIPLLFVAAAAWRYLALREKLPLPGALVRLLLVILILVGVMLKYRTVTGLEAGSALLVNLLGLKLLEMCTRRDVLLTILLGYFLIVTNFLYSQEIYLTIYLLGVTVILTGSLISLVDAGEELSTRQRLRLSASLLAQAVPLMLVLFLLFPRIEGPLWSLPKDAYASLSGLSDSMTPGSIGQLTLSDEVAFRVKFDGPIPPPDQLYWRGPVLWWTDGQTWRSGLAETIEPSLTLLGQPVEYTVILEAHDQPWLFGLEMPGGPPEGRGFWTGDYQLQDRRPIRERIRYRLRSHPHYVADYLSQQQRWGGTRLPANLHPKAKQLAAQWQAENPRPEALVQRALRYFREEDFVYTLSPPVLDKDPVDEFLFDTRQGFCEHYAAAFTTLMRAAKIPARVVTGYQGGELNPLGNYLVVRQRDAHAWSEVWLEGRGWVRVDPTAAVSSARVEGGIDQALPTAFRPAWQIREDAWLARAWKQTRDGWDAVNNSWNEWVLGYGPEYQQDLLAWLGLGQAGYKGLAALLSGLLVLLLAGLAGWVLWRIPRHGDPAQRLYLRFCARLARRGLPRKASEGPLDFAARASARYPEWAGQIGEIARLYVELRYRAATPEGFAGLTAALRRFRP